MRTVRRPIAPLRHVRSAAACAAVMTLAGCGDSATPGARAEVRDSAGIRIVTSASPTWSSGSGWTVDSVPSLDLGLIDGPAELTFDGIRAVRPLADGGLLVAQETEIRQFDGALHVRTVGGKGSGPGEFQLIAGVAVCGSRILASDFLTGTLTWFGLDGVLGGSVPMERTSFQTTPFLAGCAGDAPVLLVPPAPSRASPPVVERGAAALVVIGDEGSVTDTITTLPGLEIYDGLAVPFGRESAYAVRDSLLYFGDTGIPEMRVAGLDGQLRRIFRFAVEPEGVTPADIERIRTQYLDAPPALVEEIQPRLDALTLHGTMPFFQDIFVAPDGTIWLQGYYPLRDGENRTWQVFAPDGGWLGPVTMPAGLRVHAVTRDQVIGVWRDVNDVEHVRVHAIHR